MVSQLIGGVLGEITESEWGKGIDENEAQREHARPGSCATDDVESSNHNITF